MRPALPQTALISIQRSGYGTARPVNMAVMPMVEAGKLYARHCVHDAAIFARRRRLCQEYRRRRRSVSGDVSVLPLPPGVDTIFP
jgi:hypothetical protein